MKNPAMRWSLVGIILLLPVLSWAQVQGLKTIKLNEPNKKRGLPVMEALSVRASAREWSSKELALQDLSDLLWAANGINRPDSKKRTASSAMNAQDVDIYVFMKDGAYLYDAASQSLVPIAAGDFRSEIVMEHGGAEKSAAPIQLILVSDTSRFSRGAPEMKLEIAAIDTGIVSQNISIVCAATGMATRPRASMARDKIKSILKLKETQYALLNHPIGYPK